MLAEGRWPGCASGVLHGRLPADEKGSGDAFFSAVSWTCFVGDDGDRGGVDVPNATAMVIMDADRFGRPNLHQLRGRVGRARRRACACSSPTLAGHHRRATASTRWPPRPTASSWPARPGAAPRGRRARASQSGRRSGLRLLSLLRDERTITEARDRAWELVAKDPFLTEHPGLAAWSPK